ncbi:MAG: hypothetical protein EBS61_08175 [Betaproteobacteria bacterium]|nr:hypothetical protein [Betaproteobacteria bacterium]
MSQYPGRAINRSWSHRRALPPISRPVPYCLWNLSGNLSIDFGLRALILFLTNNSYLNFNWQKVVLIDDSLSSIGSVNFDNRSFRLNFEISILINDKAFAQEISRMLEEDFQHCKPISHNLLTQRGAMFNLAVRTAKLLAPVL